MQIEDLKAWHWVVVGVLCGLLYSASLSFAGPWFDNDAMDTVDASTFEHALEGRLLRGGTPALLRKYHEGQPVIRDIVVHPPFRGQSVPGRYWVTGQLYSVGPRYKDPKDVNSPMVYAEQWTPFKYPAQAPYLGQNGPKGVGGVTYPTVTAYLAAMKGVPSNNFGYRFAWQETPAAQWTLPPVAGMLIIGIAWPVALGAMRSFGLARPPKVKAVAKPQPAPEAVPAPKAASTAGVRLVPPPTPPPVPIGETKQYGGEFYPVVKKTH